MSPGGRAGWCRLAELEARAQADASRAESAQEAHQGSVQALRAQFRAYQAAKAEEVRALEARLRRTLGISSAGRSALRRWAPTPRAKGQSFWPASGFLLEPACHVVWCCASVG